MKKTLEGSKKGADKIRGSKQSLESKLKRSKSLMGHTVSLEARKKMSISRRRKSPKVRWKLTQETKEKLSIIRKNYPKVACVCGKTVDPANYARWHKSCNVVEKDIK